MRTDSGSFLSPATGNAQGQGSALMRLLALRKQGVTPASQDTGGAGYVPPASAPTGNAINPSQIAAAGAQPPSQPVQGPPGMGAQAEVPPTQPNINPGEALDPHSEALQTAMGALSNYIAGHTKALQADHGVPEKEARAKVIASQANAGPSSSPVS